MQTLKCSSKTRLYLVLFFLLLSFLLFLSSSPHLLSPFLPLFIPSFSFSSFISFILFTFFIFLPSLLSFSQTSFLFIAFYSSYPSPSHFNLLRISNCSLECLYNKIRGGGDRIREIKSNRMTTTREK